MARDIDEFYGSTAVPLPIGVAPPDDDADT